MSMTGKIIAKLISADLYIANKTAEERITFRICFHIFEYSPDSCAAANVIKKTIKLLTYCFVR
jgi:hypothetical protein